MTVYTIIITPLVYIKFTILEIAKLLRWAAHMPTWIFKFAVWKFSVNIPIGYAWQILVLCSTARSNGSVPQVDVHFTYNVLYFIQWFFYIILLLFYSILFYFSSCVQCNIHHYSPTCINAFFVPLDQICWLFWESNFLYNITNRLSLILSATEFFTKWHRSAHE